MEFQIVYFICSSLFLLHFLPWQSVSSYYCCYQLLSHNPHHQNFGSYFLIFGKCGVTQYHLYRDSLTLSKNIDKLKKFLGSLNGSFSVVVVTEAWCNKTVKKESLLETPNYSALHKIRNSWKGGRICIYVHESPKFSVTDNIDIFNE